MKLKSFVFMAGIALMFSGCSVICYKASKDTYMKERLYTCKVLSKLDNQYDTHVKGVAYHNRDFVLVLSSEGKSFSLDVNPVTWATTKEGDTLQFILAPYQLDIYNGVPFRGFALMIIVIIITAVLQIEWWYLLN